MKIDTAPEDGDASLNDRPAKGRTVTTVNSYHSEYSVTIGDDGMIAFMLYSNTANEWWLDMYYFKDEIVYEDEDDASDNDPDAEDEGEHYEERIVKEINHEMHSDPRTVAFTNDVPADAKPVDIGEALLEAYEQAGGYTGDGGDWTGAFTPPKRRR